MAAGHMDRNVVGCLISITASIIQNVGLNVQKETHKIELAKPEGVEYMLTYLENCLKGAKVSEVGLHAE